MLLLLYVVLSSRIDSAESLPSRITVTPFSRLLVAVFPMHHSFFVATLACPCAPFSVHRCKGLNHTASLSSHRRHRPTHRHSFAASNAEEAAFTKTKTCISGQSKFIVTKEGAPGGFKVSRLMRFFVSCTSSFAPSFTLWVGGSSWLHLTALPTHMSIDAPHIIPTVRVTLCYVEFVQIETETELALVMRNLYTHFSVHTSKLTSVATHLPTDVQDNVERTLKYDADEAIKTGRTSHHKSCVA